MGKRPPLRASATPTRIGIEMSDRPLTDAQLTTLAKIAAGEVYEAKFGHAAWRICGASPTVVGRLVRTLALAAWGPMNAAGDRRACDLTAAGR